MAISDFILARVAEEESLAHAALEGRPDDDAWSSPSDADHFNRWNPWRVQSACLARRLIVRGHRDAGPKVVRVPGARLEIVRATCETCRDPDGRPAQWPCYTLRVLASEWADHPDFRPEWRLGRSLRQAVRPSGGRQGLDRPHPRGRRGA
jgi:hypothetical protein